MATCPHCLAEFTRDKAKSHNCFKDLREMIGELAQENRQLKNKNQELKTTVKEHEDRIFILENLPYLEKLEQDTVLQYRNAKLFDLFKGDKQMDIAP